MRKPNLKNLKIATPATKQIRSAMAGQKSVKITINIDADILAEIKSIAAESGVPYQRLLNRKLRENFIEPDTKSVSRLDRIEQEIRSIKKKLAA